MSTITPAQPVISPDGAKQWELVSHDPMERTDRLSIEAGHLYRTTVWADKEGHRTVTTAMVFISTPSGSAGPVSGPTDPASTTGI